MANLLGGLLSAVGGAGEGGFKAWGEDIKEKEKEKRQINVEQIKQAALEKRMKNLAQFEHGLEKERLGIEHGLDKERMGMKQGFESGESEKTRSFESEQAEKNRRSAERIAGMKGHKETSADKKYRETQAVNSIVMEFMAEGVPVQETEHGLVVSIPTDQKGKPKDINMLKRIDNAGLQFKTGTPRKAENNWFSPDVWVTDVFVSGLKPDAGYGTGLLSGTTEDTGMSDFDRLKSKLDQKTGQAVQPKSIAKKSTTSTGLLESGTAGTNEVPYRTKITEPVTKEQEQAAIKELTDLANKLGVGPGNWKALAQQAKQVGGWAWNAYQRAWNNLINSQKGARESLPAYNK